MLDKGGRIDFHEFGNKGGDERFILEMEGFDKRGDYLEMSRGVLHLNIKFCKKDKILKYKFVIFSKLRDFGIATYLKNGFLESCFQVLEKLLL